MQVKYFTENDTVRKIIKELKTKNLIVSDVLDSEGHQYVDLVQEGGGVLGIALLGYTYVLEQVGIRFFSLAGTSAGAINTLLLASVDTVEKPKTEKIIELIANKNLYDFVDGPFFVKLLVKAFRTNKEDTSLPKKIVKKIIIVLWTIIWVIPVVVYLFIKKGLNRGKNFRDWVTDILNQNNINSYNDLKNIRNAPDNISIRPGGTVTNSKLKPGLKIITSEVTTESKIIFPEMNLLIWSEPGKVNPADYLRASMSIPVFFQPYKIKVENKNHNDWPAKVNFEGKPPETVYFVDGGVLSNFPIDSFHNPDIVPRLPTFGIKLGSDRDKVTKVKSLMKFLMSIFNSARHVLDDQFLLQNKDYKLLIKKINIGEHNWLNFSISDKDKLDLFCRGAKAASEFLTNFDWNNYKKIRADLINK